MCSRKKVLFLLISLVAQVCLILTLIVTPLYAQQPKGGYCTSCAGGCFTYGCDFSGCWFGPCHCQCMCCVDGECVWDSVHECDPKPE
jgi:hypothetical protein